MAQNVETCLKNFYASDIYNGLKSHGKGGWLEVEEFSSFKANSFSVTMAEVEGIKGYIKGSVKDMRSLLKDPENNVPLPEDQFAQGEDEGIIFRCNFRKVCRG